MLDKLIQIKDLRQFWKDEARDFTPWLAEEENLMQLADTLNIDINFIERESSVGGFNADILAEDNDGNKIIIENQLEDTNHDHLGKIITYASGKDARYIIWIVKKARDEHRQAVEWLNQHTDSGLFFFLVEIELWKIGNSRPAPRFNIIVRPNDWAKEEKKEKKYSKQEELLLNYWRGFNEYAEQDTTFQQYFKTRKPQSRHSYDISIGTGICHIFILATTRKKEITVGLYFRQKDRQSYFSLKDSKDLCEKLLKEKTYWREANKDSKVFVLNQFDIDDTSSWNESYKWIVNLLLPFKKCAEIIKK